MTLCCTANFVMNDLFALLAHLDTSPPDVVDEWHGWRIAPVAGGANNLLYRASSELGDFAIKFTVRDERDRAGREYGALRALEEAGTTVAPRAVLLERERFRQPVVVQTWLEGAPLHAPPTNHKDWHALLDHFCRIHTLTPAHTTVALPEATINAASVAAGKALVHKHLDRIPQAAYPATLRPLIEWLNEWQPPIWPTPPCALCRVDSNPRNFLARTGGYVSVDWENSGWGDPAFEWADMQTHPAYLDCTPSWDTLISAYAKRMHDPTAPERIAAYTTIMTIWWVVRWARYLYEVPRGLDPRLAAEQREVFE